MNTCGKCHFYEAGVTITLNDKNKTTKPGGVCYGAPPSVAAGTVEYPTVVEDQRECALWRATPKRGRTK